MSLVSTLETLCMHCSKLEQLASEGNKYNFSSGCIAYDIGAHEFGVVINHTNKHKPWMFLCVSETINKFSIATAIFATHHQIRATCT